VRRTLSKKISPRNPKIFAGRQARAATALTKAICRSTVERFFGGFEVTISRFPPPPGVTRMLCPQCGQSVPEGATLCPTCGRQTAVTPSSVDGLPPLAPTAASGPVAPGETSGMAIASLIFGLLFLFFPLSIVAIVLGHISLSQIKKSAGRLGGKGLAIAGLVLGYLGVAMIPLILIIAAIAIPNLLRARIAANEASAVNAVRRISAAQMTYQSQFPTVGFAPDLQSLGGATPCSANPATACLIENELAAATTLPGKHGYIFALKRTDDGTKYVVTAVPTTRNQTGIRSFCSNEDGVARVDSSGTEIPDHDACAALSAIK
jgi:type IV pilus assembly protein PilA